MTLWKIAMVTHMSGSRYDDRMWPPPGIENAFWVPQWEGEGLVYWHHAVKIDERPDHEPEHVTAPAPVSLPAETAAGPVPGERSFRAETGVKAEQALEQVPAGAEAPEPPKPADPKADWTAYAIARGEDPDVASRMTKADLMSRYGGRL